MFLKLESGDFDGLQQTIVQCRKKIAFAGYTRRMHPRLFLIIDLLMWISRKEDTGALFLHKKDELQLLENGAGEYQWNPGGYEVVRFDTWIKSKFTTRLSA